MVGDLAIQMDGWIFVDTQITFDIKYYWFFCYCTFDSRVIVPLTADFLQLQIYRTTRDVHSRLIASLLPVTIITKEKHPIYVSADQSWI